MPPPPPLQQPNLPLLNPTLSIPPSKTLLLLIDIQKAFIISPATFGASPQATSALETTVPTLLSAFRAAKANVVHVAHHSTHANSPLHPNHPGNGVAFTDFAAPLPGETVMSKKVNSAFIGTNLEELLRESGIRRLVVAGLTTGHCVSTSVRMASNLAVTGWHGYGAPPGALAMASRPATAGRDTHERPRAHERERLAEEDGEGEEGKEEEGQIILISDACAASALQDAVTGEILADAETAHRLQVETLRGEFCDVLSVGEAVGLIRRDAGSSGAWAEV